jgi:hypothetical protein
VSPEARAVVGHKEPVKAKPVGDMDEAVQLAEERPGTAGKFVHAILGIGKNESRPT